MIPKVPGPRYRGGPQGVFAMSESQTCPECRHVFPNGRRCHAPALRGKPLCYFHSRNRVLVELNRSRDHSVALPPLEDRGAIQVAINEVLAALAAGKLDQKQVWPYLVAIQMAARNLVPPKGAEQPIVCPQPVQDFEEKFDQPLAVSTAPGAPPETPVEYPDDLWLPKLEAAATHEYDPEGRKPEPSRPPAPPRPVRPGRWGLFTSRAEMNMCYDAEDAWFRGFTAGQCCPERLEKPTRTAEELEAELAIARKAKKAGLSVTLSPELEQALESFGLTI
jgi:hypothetical protein